MTKTSISSEIKYNMQYFVTVLKECYLLDEGSSIFDEETLKRNIKLNQCESTKRRIDFFYDQVKRRLTYTDFKWLGDIEINAHMRLAHVAYLLSKHAHAKQIRKDWERYFEHPFDVSKILLFELNDPKLSELLIGLLHDVLEDTYVEYTTLENLFWEYVAMGVRWLSKLNINNYYTKEEKYAFNKCRSQLLKDTFEKWLRKRLKRRRDNAYYHQLSELNDSYLKVKFADRIHNLRTLYTLSPVSILKKITETQRYLLPIARKKNLQAYEIMNNEIEKLENYLVQIDHL